MSDSCTACSEFSSVSPLSPAGTGRPIVPRAWEIRSSRRNRNRRSSRARRNLLRCRTSTPRTCCLSLRGKYFITDLLFSVNGLTCGRLAIENEKRFDSIFANKNFHPRESPIIVLPDPRRIRRAQSRSLHKLAYNSAIAL